MTGAYTTRMTWIDNSWRVQLFCNDRIVASMTLEEWSALSEILLR